ncbi:hypothetical protein PR729_12675 [Providencia rettgeri]|nr:hypothetical protein PR729_12675 [Providencia rettgeri]
MPFFKFSFNCFYFYFNLKKMFYDIILFSLISIFLCMLIVGYIFDIATNYFYFLIFKINVTINELRNIMKLFNSFFGIFLINYPPIKNFVFNNLGLF